MKKQFLFYLLSIISYVSLAQTNYEKGYFIKNSGESVNCLIKNIDWKDNPTEFNYKLNENDSQKKASVETVKEFGIDNISKFLCVNVLIDRSTSNIDNLTKYREPVFKEEKLFLKVFIEGKANLYYYEDKNLRRFFFKTENADIKQLVFKNYRKSGNIIGENNHYKQQLLNNLKCNTVNLVDFNKIEYNKNDLIEVFEKYNFCNGEELINFEEKQKRDAFNFSVRAGLTSSSLKFQYHVSPDNNVDFDNEISVRLGIETEFLLPFNNDKWAIILEPTYQRFSSKQEVVRANPHPVLEDYNVEVDYKTFELPFGVRHYFYLNDKSKIFVNASYAVLFTIDSSIAYDTGTTLKISKGSASELGLGFNHNNSISIECRYSLPRDIMKNYRNYSADYNRIAVIFGYSFL